MLALALSLALSACARNDLRRVEGGPDVAAFDMQTHEVTVAEYWRCIHAGKCPRPDRLRVEALHSDRLVAGKDDRMCNRQGRPHHPINCISVEAARSYCAWIGMRLPNQAEWIWAAQSGAEARTHPWGEANPTCDVTVMATRVKLDFRYGCNRGGTWAVGSKHADQTKDGIFDLGGNVEEIAESPSGPVIMGGDFSDSSPEEFRLPPMASESRAANLQYSANEWAPFNSVGFRCVN